jgi:hypothetical protein
LVEKPSSLSIKRFFRLILILFIVTIALNYGREHLFILGTGSEIELKGAIIVKVLQLRGISTDTCICNENIQGINVTGYRFMRLAEIQDIAKSAGNLNYCCISECEYNGVDVSVTVMKIFKRSGYESELDGVMYRFHRYYLNLWGWSDYLFRIS